MKLANLVGVRFKERPSDCQIDSHALMVRGGYIKYVANGIYSSFMPLKRITRKIEQIIREEMDKIDGQEVSFPVVLPASLWEESGRYDSVGSELLRFSDRNDAKCVLGMTHEEAAVQLVSEYANSYSRYPFMIYQIQTKFRDEARPRAGLIRVREFTMKDAYSFHTNKEDLENYYDRCHVAYENIYARAGLPQVISVASDSGMMGGSLSHEFMFLTPIGEDTIVTCSKCNYKSNMEAAENILTEKESTDLAELTLVHTPNMKTIEEVAGFLNVTEKDTAKAVVYRKATDDKLVVLFLRGDYEVNEAKLRNYIKSEIVPAEISEESGLVAGFIGGHGLNTDATVIYDVTLQNEHNLICGGNKVDYHYTGFNISRDVGEVEYVDCSKVKEGSVCPTCKQETLQISRGIEVGNIFQLGDKYSKAMNLTYLDENGDSKHPIMGCYGIGVGRLVASICENSHDDYGPIWPMAVAPWQVHICAVRIDDPDVKALAHKICSELTDRGIEVIFDDRAVSAGVMFSDADLLGVPVRVTVSPRNLKENAVEITSRDKTISKKVDKEICVEDICEIIKNW